MVNQCIYTEIFWVKIELSYHFGCGTRRFQFSRSKKLAFFATQLTSSHLELSFACLVCLERSHKISGYELNNENPNILKSVNLQYNTLGRLDNGTNESSTKRLMFQVLFFFMISCKIPCKNPFNLFSYFFYKITKIKIKSFECPKSIKSIKK